MVKLGKFHQQGFTLSQTTSDTKMVINRVPEHPPGPEFGMHPPTISPEVLPCPKGVKIIQIRWFKQLLEGS